MSPAPRPGWYPDPAGTSDLYRWWDGGDWTEAISESPRAPSPRTLRAADPDEDPPRRRRSRFTSVVALLVCLALFLSATVGLGLAIWQEPPRIRGSQPGLSGADPGSALPTALDTADRLELGSRTAMIGAASMTLPDRPYHLLADPVPVAGLMDVVFLANAPVHERYDGRRTWSAAVLLGRLSTTARTPEELRQRAEETVRRLSRTLLDGVPTEVRHLQVADRAVGGQRGLVLTADVGYEVPHLPSRADRLTAVLVALDDGSVVAAVSSVPDDAPVQVESLAAASLASLTVG